MNEQRSSQNLRALSRLPISACGVHVDELHVTARQGARAVEAIDSIQRSKSAVSKTNERSAVGGVLFVDKSLDLSRHYVDRDFIVDVPPSHREGVREFIQLHEQQTRPDAS